MQLTLPTPMTADEFSAAYSSSRVELIDGIIQELPMPDTRHGKMAFKLAHKIATYLDENDIGTISGLDSFVKVSVNPLRVRGADICFYSYDRLPKGPTPSGLLPNIPDLVAEVVSPSDRWNEVLQKVAEYLNVDVRVVVVLDSKTRTATLFRSHELPQKIDNGDDLVIEDVLPGFRTKLAPLFD